MLCNGNLITYTFYAMSKINNLESFTIFKNQFFRLAIPVYTG